MNCSICEEEGLLRDRSYVLTVTFKSGRKYSDIIHFINICQYCDTYLSVATAEDIYHLHRGVSKRLNPLRKKRVKKSLWSRIKCFLTK